MTKHCARTGKQGFRTRGEAERAARRMLAGKKNKEPPGVYRCSECGCYHVTHYSYGHCKCVRELVKKGIYDAWKGYERLKAIYERDPELAARPLQYCKRYVYNKRNRPKRVKRRPPLTLDSVEWWESEPRRVREYEKSKPIQNIKL